MADIVNLRQVRKAKSKSDKERKSAENRVLFGESKAQRQKRAVEQKQAKALLDGARRKLGEADKSE